MLRIVVTIFAVSHLVTAMPQQQRGVQLLGRPTAASQGAYGPSYSQQLAFGGQSSSSLQQQPQQQTSATASPQIRARIPSIYQSQQPIIISQANPSASPATPTAFASFPGAQFGAGRQILTLRSPAQQSQSNDEDEYEYEDDDEPTIQTRPSPTPSRQPTRAPVRVNSPTPGSSLGFGAGAGRFVQAQPQQSRQRVPQQQAIPVAAAPHQSARLAPQQGGQNQRPNNAGFGLDGKRSRLTTPPPIQTVNRYMKQNDDGSITWGYENEDGTFKEETLGADCVVRGKYGYIDPEGNKREYEYQTGNPCDPNKKDQEEEAEEEEDLPDGPSRPQQIAGVLNARPRPLQRRPIQGQIPQQYQAQPQYQ